MRILKKIHKLIPGFRQLKTNSMVIAATYYGAAIFIFIKYWHWGLALLALPFLVFSLLERNAESGGRAVTVLAAAAGLLVLLGAAGGLAQGGAGAAEAPHPAVPAPSVALALPSPTPVIPASAADNTPKPSLQRSAFPSAAPIFAAAGRLPAAAPTPADSSGYAYVATKTGKVFHNPDCYSARRIKPENLIGYKTRQEAVDAGRTPCKICKP